MKLISLRLIINDKVVRVVPFNAGLNLVTNDRTIGRSGNSVGKSTLSRVVDYIFLGSLSPIYIDEEFGKPNSKIEILFKESDVIVELTFTNYSNKMHSICRNLPIDKDEIFFFDGETVDKKKYEEKLLCLAFDVKTRRPSVRSLVPKFIRNDSRRMLHTTKFLDQNSSKKDYSELFLFLFGFENTALLTEKRDANNLVKRKKKIKESVNSLVREQKPNTEIKEIKGKLKQLERNLLKFDYSPKYDNPIAELHKIQDEEDKLIENSLVLELKIENINKTIEKLSERGGNYLCKELKEIYEFANVEITSVIKKYEDALSFHDNLVNRKKQFLEVDLPALVEKHNHVKDQIRYLHKNKLDVFAALRSRESIDRITKNIKELGELKNSLGKLEGLVEQRANAESDFRDSQKALSAILEQISKQMNSVKLFEEFFNKYFRKITESIHNEVYDFNLNFDPDNGVCEPEIINRASNPEGGKKKAEVIAFDFSYIHAVNKLKLKRPAFVFHDSIEDIDQKQIEVIFELAEQLPGQQILSMLSDKLSEPMYKKYLKKTILLLSEDDMFFRVQP
jgi:hypothetical protein